MQLSGRPLLDNAVDMKLFVDREGELASLRFAIAADLNVLLSGEAGAGKTSLCRRLMFQLRRDTPIVYARSDGVDDPAVLVALIAEQVFKQGPSLALTVGTLNQNLANLRAWRSSLASSTGPGGEPSDSPIVIVDDVTADAGHAVFGRLRDQIWELRMTWIVCVRPPERGGLLLPPADAFFERRIDLGPLDESATGEMIEKRLGRALDPSTARLAKSLDGNPRRVLEAVRELVGPDATMQSASEAAIALERRQLAIQALGRPAAMAANELDAIGSASASDAALLDRLGWTRSRATQVLGELERAGLVRSDHVRGGAGRPRKVYRLVAPAEYLRERGLNGDS